MLLALATGLCGGYIMARHLAVLYMGVVLDIDKGEVYFPFDMQSYGVLDYISLRFLHDYCNVDSVPLASIRKISRGNRGKDLYLTGEFDARSITMSSKQKRDECLELIQSAIGKRGILMNEIEGY